jgi:hypothetical protein
MFFVQHLLLLQLLPHTHHLHNQHFHCIVAYRSNAKQLQTKQTYDIHYRVTIPQTSMFVWQQMETTIRYGMFCAAQVKML